ncbi:MAG: hypothetical protein JWR84_637 [Caulobacter sp.]|nr:hypothetical protein [Caulobacter sp.]
MIRAVSLTLAAALCLAASAPEGRLEQYFRLRQEAGAAIKANDLATAESRLEDALALYPTSPGSLIRLARVEVAAGKPAEAVGHLRTYASLGLTWDILGDEALAALVPRADFEDVTAQLAWNGTPIGKPAVAAEMPKAGPIYEGLVWQDDHWLVSSVSERTIYKVDRKGVAAPFLKADAATAGVFGMALDGKTLWAAEAGGPEIPGSAGPARTALLKIDSRTGAILARYPVDGGESPLQLGDVVVGPNGTVYASASVGSAIYRLKPGAKALDVVLTTNEMGSPQGMVVCPGGALLIADYSSGLHRLDLKTGQLDLVGGTPAAMVGTDGLFAITLSGATQPVVVATQNGVSPARVLMLHLSHDCRRIEKVDTLAANHAALEDLTLGAAMPGQVAVIGRGGWAGYGGDGKPLADAKAETAQILTIPLPRD